MSRSHPSQSTRRWRALTSSIVLAIASLLVTSCHKSATKGGLPVGRINHVWVIVLENEDAATSFGPDSPAPYLATTLAGQGQLLSQYFATAHLSLPNYLAMISGQAPTAAQQGDCASFSDFVATGALDADGQAAGTGCVYPANVKTLADQLTAAGHTWRGYMEDMGNDPNSASTCRHPVIDTVDQTHAARVGDQYATRHNPFMYFHSVIDSPDCATNVVALTALDADLASAATTPNFSFITPNLCNDGHDAPCVDGAVGGLAQVNGFLQTLVPKILASAAYQDGGLIIITFDEAETFSDQTACCDELPGVNVTDPGLLGPGGGVTGAVLLSPFIRPGTVNDTPYNHYALLRSIEDLFRLPHLGYAGRPGLRSFGSDVFAN